GGRGRAARRVRRAPGRLHRGRGAGRGDRPLRGGRRGAAAGRAAAGRDRPAGRGGGHDAAGGGGPVSSTSQSQVRRLLSLVPYLREHDGVSLTEVAAAFNVSEETLRGDLNVLWMCGMPGLMPGDLIEIDMDAVDGEGVIHLSNADYLTRPLRLTADEALALVL